MTSTEKSSADATRVITLGTAGGPQWWREPGGDPTRAPAGIATAIVVGDAVYLVDAGYGTGGQLARAGLGMSRLRGVFLTHLHSDHVVDLPGLVLFGTYELRGNPHTPVPVIGPGDRGILPLVSSHAVTPPQPVSPDEPTPGTASMVGHLVSAFATDINDRVLDALRARPDELFQAQDIEIPADLEFHANDNPTPTMEPFEVYRDERVRVTAILVRHPPIAPAFAFRFDTPGGSVTISGDTAPCDNLVRLATGTDLLLHEAIDEQWLAEVYGGDLGEMDNAGIAHHRRAHTTPREAGELADRAGARRLALHHLVPGGLPPDRWRAAVEGFTGELLVPQDLDVIPLRN